MENIYQPIRAELLKVVIESPTIKTFILSPEKRINFKAGQFIELSLPGIGEAPFTPSSSPYEEERLEITIMRTGYLTEALHQIEPGAILGVRGPYGKEYPLENFKEKEVLLVGGGVGLAPLRSLFLTLIHQIDDYKNVLFCGGAKSPADLIYKECLLNTWQRLNEKVRLNITVDKGDEEWKGQVGLVTCTLNNLKECIKEVKNSLAVVCGPPIMMKFTTFKLLELGYQPSQIYLSMERMMVCGLGKCAHCNIGPYYVCKDGPVFTYDQIKDFSDIWV